MGYITDIDCPLALFAWRNTDGKDLFCGHLCDIKKSFKRVGKYEFPLNAEFTKVEKLSPTPKYEKRMCTTYTVKSTDYHKEDFTVAEGLVDILVGVEYPDNRVLMEKINEIIDRINTKGE